MRRIHFRRETLQLRLAFSLFHTHKYRGDSCLVILVLTKKRVKFVCQTAATLRLDMKVLRLRLQLPEPQIRLVNKSCCTSLQASFYIPDCQQERRSVRRTGVKQHLSVHFLQLLPSSYLKKTLS